MFSLRIARSLGDHTGPKHPDPTRAVPNNKVPSAEEVAHAISSAKALGNKIIQMKDNVTSVIQELLKLDSVKKSKMVSKALKELEKAGGLKYIVAYRAIFASKMLAENRTSLRRYDDCDAVIAEAKKTLRFYSEADGEKKFLQFKVIFTNRTRGARRTRPLVGP